MKRYLKEIISLCLVFVFVCAALPLYANAADAVITNVAYTVTHKSGAGSASEIREGDALEITVTFESDIELSTNVVKQADSFTATSAEASCEKLSDASPYRYSAEFKGLTYTGDGKTLAFNVSHEGETQNVSVTVSECNETEKKPAGQPGSDFYVSSYTTSGKSNGGPTAVTMTIMRTDRESGNISVVRNVDDFRGGANPGDIETVNSDGVYKVTINNLHYRGSGDTLAFTLNYWSGGNAKFQNMTVKIAECTPYVEPSEEPDYSTPEAKPAPKILFDCSDLAKPIAANETANIKITVTNCGTGTTIKSAIMTLEPAGELMIFGGQDAYYIKEIKANSSVEFNVTVTAAQKITTQSQVINASLSFDYYNNISNVTATADGKLTLPAEVTPEEKEEEKKEEPEKIANPVPLIILSNYSYGGASVAAGEEVNLSFSFRNTSKTTAIENVMLSVNSGADLTINGSTNTFYFDMIEANGTKNVTIPLKAVQRISNSTENVGLNFSYEYVDQDQRNSNSSELKISVPLYQPDRFEISDPVVAYVGFVGEETSLTMDYVNKGKTEVSNVEARIEGDVDCPNNLVRAGNLESGKSGTIAFVVTPMLEGDNQVKITVSYEDTNGDVKERVFETTLSAMAQEPFDPGEWEEPIEPIDEGSGFPWWIFVLAALILLIIILIVAKKKKKKAKLQAEQALWDDWDDEPGAKKAEPAEATSAAATEELAK